MKSVKNMAISLAAVFSIAISSSGLYASAEDLGNNNDSKYFYANNSINSEIINLSSKISEEQLQEIKSSVCSKLVYEDGLNIPVKSTVKIEDMSLSNNTSVFFRNNLNSYKLSVSTVVDEKELLNTSSETSKTVSDSSERNTSDVAATIELDLVWIDGPGLNNKIYSVHGKRTVTRGTVSSATLKYGNGYDSAFIWTSVDVKNNSDYTCTPNIYASKPAALYDVTFRESRVSLYVDVAASIFQ